MSTDEMEVDGLEDQDEDKVAAAEGGDDPVVRKIDVYLSTTLYERLHLIQYPNRPFYRPYDLPVMARVKPANHVLEMECDIPRGREAGQHYDEDAPRHLRIDRMKLESSFVDPLTTYAIGTIQGNDLHLTPVHGVFQMRPSTAHVDSAADEMIDGEVEDEEESDEEGESKKPQEPAPVKLQHLEYKKQESKKALMAKRATWAYKKQVEDAEAWVNLEVHGAESGGSGEEFEKMFCPDMDRHISLKKDSGVFTDMSRAAASREAAEAANSETMGVAAVADSSAPPGDTPGAAGVSKNVLTSLKGEEQVQATLERAGVVCFAQLLDLAGPDASPSDTLDYVRSNGVLVRGNWVRKSSLCHLPPRLAEARDAMLLLLERYGGVNRFQFGTALGLDEQEVLLLLHGVATLDRKRRMWMLKNPDDLSFLSKHPGVAAAEVRHWNERERELRVIMSMLGKPDCEYPGPVAAPTPASGRAIDEAGPVGAHGASQASLPLAPPRASRPLPVSMDMDNADDMAAGKGKGKAGAGGASDAEGGGGGEVKSPTPSAAAARRPTTLPPGQRSGALGTQAASVKKFKPKKADS